MERSLTDPGGRYARHIALPGVGIDGNRRIREGRVLVVGAGGLGSPALLYLAAAGVGHVTVIDDDRVSLSNLQRQVVHDTAAVGQLKVEVAAARMRALNPDVMVTPLAERVGPSNAGALVSGFDVVIDGSDNFPTRYLLSDACAAAAIPYVYGSVQGFDGQAAVLCDDAAPCYRCLFPEPPPPGSVPACGESGVLGMVPGIIGTIQAAETIKLLAGAGEVLRGRLLLVDGLRMRFLEVAVERLPDCSGCRSRGPGTTPPTSRMSDAMDDSNITPTELEQRLDAGEPIVVIDVREDAEWQIGHLAAARHIPMDRVREVADALDPSAPTVVYCHHGMRSATVADWLRRSGFSSVRNLVGGIDRWSTDVDPAVPRY